MLGAAQVSQLQSEDKAWEVPAGLAAAQRLVLNLDFQNRSSEHWQLPSPDTMGRERLRSSHPQHRFWFQLLRALAEPLGIPRQESRGCWGLLMHLDSPSRLTHHLITGEDRKLSLPAVLLEGAVLLGGDLGRFCNRFVQCHSASNASPPPH